MDKANTTNNEARKGGLKVPPALNPEQVALTQPYREFVATGLIETLSVTFSGGTTTISAKLGSHVEVKEGQTREGLTPTMAKNLIVASGLWTPPGSKDKKGGKDRIGQLPSKTLVKGDFEEVDPKKFEARVLSVAKALGPSTARGRIGSLRYMQKGVDNFEKWWNRAPSPAKARVLMDGKHFSELTQEQLKKISAVPCPFLGTEAVPTPTEEEAEEEQEGQGPPTS